MIKYFIALFCMGLALSYRGESTLSKKCHTLFQTGEQYDLPKSSKWNHPYSAQVFSSVLHQLEFLEGKALSKKEIANYKKGFESSINQIESFFRGSSTAQWDFIGAHWLSAVEAFPKIVSFINSNKSSEYESLDTKTIIKIILATFSQHTVTYLTHPEAEKLDWPRFLLILKSISYFKDNSNGFSLYKIKRAVRGKYSVNEYIHCK